MRNVLIYSSSGLAVALMLSFSQAASAQAVNSDASTDPEATGDAEVGPETPAETNQTGEIVVTASRRAENLQDVPMSITALSAQTLENKVATQFFDYAPSIPNLSFAVGGIGASSGRSIAVRGIADVNTTGFYIDDSPLPESLDPRILDVERIEVLRGPQGTLYGARSLGGTVRLITIQPDASETSGRIHGLISSTRNTDRANYQVDGAINLPIVADRVGLRIAALHQKDAGYFTRTFDAPAGETETVRNVGQSVTDGISASVVAEVTDDLSITPRILYQKTRMNGYPLADVAVNDSSVVPNFLRVGSLDQRRTFDLPEMSQDEWVLGTLDIKLDKSFGTITSATTLFNRTTRDVEDMSDFMAAAFGLDPQLASTIEVRHPIDSFAQELRFSSSFDGPIQLVAGLFYNNLRSNEVSPPITLAGLDDATGGALGTDFLYEKRWPTAQKDYAVYGEVSWSITPSLTAVAGARVFQNETKSSIMGDGIVYGGLVTRAETTLKERGVTPKASLQYEFSRGNQIYLTAAKGFRPGGPNQLFPASFGCPQELVELGVDPDDAAFYKSDSVWSYEAGAKATMLDGRLRASAAAFRIDWSNIQQRVELHCGFGFINNSGSARSQGFELELTANPVEGLTIGAGGGHVDAKFLESTVGSKFKPGDRIPQVPAWNFNASADYRRELGSNLDGFLHADYAYVSSSDSSINANVNPATGRLVPRIRPSYEIVNARIGISINDIYEIAAFAKNLTDERSSLSDITNAASEAPDRARVSINQPRTIGVEMRARF